MQHFSPDQIKEALFDSIHSLLDERDRFLVNPDSDFSRTKKISFAQTILFPMVAGSDNVATELLDLFGEDDLPLPSSMIQRRNQVKPAAFQKLFSSFLRKIPVRNTFRGYQLVCCDGSRINLPYNPSDPDTYIQCIDKRKGINQIHLNALYDPLNDLFLDALLQSVPEMDEKGAFCSFLDNYAHSGKKQIFIADRGFASYNILAHALHNGQLFLIRVPESFAAKICTVKEQWLSGASEDEEISVYIGRRQTKRNRQLENYHCIPSAGHYDYLEPGTDMTDRLSLRVLKFPISEDSFEYIVTNLPAYAFSLQIIKDLYKLRWGQETAFRYLKYAGNMVHIHSLKKEFLLQEIYGKLTLYNFSSFISSSVSFEQEPGKARKFSYVINHTQLQKVCIRFAKGSIKDVGKIITRMPVPVRPERKFERRLRRQSADTLTYR